MSQRYSIWLLPQQQTANLIDGFIANLGQRFATPGFSAHATLCSGTWVGNDSTLVATLESVAAQSTRVTTDSNGIRYIDSRFQFFFLGLATDGLRDIQQLALQEFTGARLPRVGPHLSLIYSNDFSGIDRAQLVDELLPQMPAEVEFDRLALVLPRDNNWEDIAHWKIAHIARLD